MAYIGHRCACRHGDLSHPVTTTGKRSCGCASCPRRCRRADKPELLPTFNAKGNQLERIVEPGQKLGTTEGEMNAKTCDCDDCKALYTELTGVEPEPATA